jgi:hypothetical protein
MEYRILLVKDIFLDNIRYSPIKKSSNENRYSYITYLNNDDEIQNIIFQTKQMNLLELYKNERGTYYINFQLSNELLNFLIKFEEKVKQDIQTFNCDIDYKFRSSFSQHDMSFKSKVGHISNLVVFDQYKKMYEEENEIIKLLKQPNQVVVPILECLGLWISNQNEVGLTWICHHIKVIQNNTLFRKYLFIDDYVNDNENEIQIVNNLDKKNDDTPKKSKISGYLSKSLNRSMVPDRSESEGIEDNNNQEINYAEY